MNRNDITNDIISTGQAKGSQEAYAKGWDAIFGNKKECKPLTHCASNRDGDCFHKDCPQLRDNEPKASGRSCPLYDWDEDND